MGRIGSFLVSLPERVVRALIAVVGGAVHETAEVTLPRFARRSRLYEATAKNLLRIAIELIGAVDREPPPGEPEADELLKRKAAGNVVELGLDRRLRILAALAARGRVGPLARLACLPGLARVGAEARRRALRETQLGTVDDVLSALEGTSGTTARLVDLPPLELAELRASLAELRRSAAELPSPQELAALYAGLRWTAARERRPLLEVSSGMGLAFVLSARTLGREHLVTPYREDWKPLRGEGFAAYYRRISTPYRDAVAGHFDPDRETWTERGLGRLRR